MSACKFLKFACKLISNGIQTDQNSIQWLQVCWWNNKTMLINQIWLCTSRYGSSQCVQHCVLFNCNRFAVGRSARQRCVRYKVWSFEQLFWSILEIENVFYVHFCICRKRRICQPFSHARLNECVEMTNPMYVGELDDTPAFIQTDETKVNYCRNLGFFVLNMQHDLIDLVHLSFSRDLPIPFMSQCMPIHQSQRYWAEIMASSRLFQAQCMKKKRAYYNEMTYN